MKGLLLRSDVSPTLYAVGTTGPPGVVAALNDKTTSKNNGVCRFTCQSKEEIDSVGGVAGGGGGWAPQTGPPLPSTIMNRAVPPPAGSVEVCDCPVKLDLLTVMVTEP